MSVNSNVPGVNVTIHDDLEVSVHVSYSPDGRIQVDVRGRGQSAPTTTLRPVQLRRQVQEQATAVHTTRASAGSNILEVPQIHARPTCSQLTRSGGIMNLRDMLPDERVEVNQEDALNPPTPPPTYSEAMLQPPVDSTNGGSSLQFLAGREASSFPGCRRRVCLILDVGNAPSNHQGQIFSPLAPNNAPINREHDFPRPGPNVQEDNDRPGSSNFHHACPAALPMSDSIFFGRSSSPLSDASMQPGSNSPPSSPPAPLPEVADDFRNLPIAAQFLTMGEDARQALQDSSVLSARPQAPVAQFQVGHAADVSDEEDADAMDFQFHRC
jgi:hypothetical protein